MKDKERAEEYASEKCKECYMCDYADYEHPEINPYEVCPWYTKRKEGYLDGLAEERKGKWHDLRKNPNDLPPRIKKLSETVINQIGTPCFYNFEKSCWQNWSYIDIETPVAWCELPEFEE